jgi:hypothetical protein
MEVTNSNPPSPYPCMDISKKKKTTTTEKAFMYGGDNNGVFLKETFRKG